MKRNNDEMERLHANLRKGIEKALEKFARQHGIRLVEDGFAFASAGEAFVAGFPVDRSLDAEIHGLLCLNVPDLGECSQLLPPDIYRVKIRRPPGHVELTGSSGRWVKVNRSSVETFPPRAGAANAIELGVGGGTADSCFPVEDFFVYVHLTGDQPDT